jgi:hypothetical protein
MDASEPNPRLRRISLTCRFLEPIADWLIIRHCTATLQHPSIPCPSKYTVLFWYKFCLKYATLAERVEFLRVSQIYLSADQPLPASVSSTSTWNTYPRIKMPDRVASWFNAVDHPMRPCVFLVNYLNFIYLKETVSRAWEDTMDRLNSHDGEIAQHWEKWDTELYLCCICTNFRDCGVDC